MLLIIAGFFMALYFISLARAYRAGELSIAYPIARAMPVIIVLAVVVYLGRVDQISLQSIIGSAFVVFGCFMIPLQRFKELRLSNYLNLTCGMALLAATCSAGYALVDDEALRYFRNHNQLAIDNTSMTILYACLEALMTSLWLTLFVVIRKKGRVDFYKVICINRWHAIVAGIGIHLSYTLVLVALAFVENVSYIVAFHRLSIPLGAALGILILKEKSYPLKLLGVLIMLVGLLGVALG
jgi:drug/metabolite transporter (DMT)-like permease